MQFEQSLSDGSLVFIRVRVNAWIEFNFFNNGLCSVAIYA